MMIMLISRYSGMDLNVIWRWEEVVCINNKLSFIGRKKQVSVFIDEIMKKKTWKMQYICSAWCCCCLKISRAMFL